MFKLDSRIENDSILLLELALCQVRLQNDNRFPWLVLVPKINAVTEVHELSTEHQEMLMQESSLVAKALTSITECKKVNVANLGNVVSQLHWHVVARFEDDAAWPGPIWGVGQSTLYDEVTLTQLTGKLLAALK